MPRWLGYQHANNGCICRKDSFNHGHNLLAYLINYNIFNYMLSMGTYKPSMEKVTAQNNNSCVLNHIPLLADLNFNAVHFLCGSQTVHCCFACNRGDYTITAYLHT